MVRELLMFVVIGIRNIRLADAAQGTVPVDLCEDAEFKATMANLNQPVMYQGSEDFAKFIKQATADYAALIKQLGITLD